VALASTSDFKAPPRGASAKTSQRNTQANAAASQNKTSAREEAANGVFQLAGFGCVIAKQYADAGAIMEHGGTISHELAKLSEQNDGIAKGLDYLINAGPYAGLITAVMPLALQIMANHKMIKAEYVAGAGVVPPEALASRVQADMARQTQMALREQQKAEQELAALRDANAVQVDEHIHLANDPPCTGCGWNPVQGNGKAPRGAKTT
jgi:hypothetical protein